MKTNIMNYLTDDVPTLVLIGSIAFVIGVVSLICLLNAIAEYTLIRDRKVLLEVFLLGLIVLVTTVFVLSIYIKISML